MNKPKLYAERDVDEYHDIYIAHVEALTTEKLDSKAAMAAELAYRDKVIIELTKNIKMLDKNTTIPKEFGYCQHNGLYSTDELRNCRKCGLTRK